LDLKLKLERSERVEMAKWNELLLNIQNYQKIAYFMVRTTFGLTI